jgi:formylglycine-generating enzyme required for sulfatase activity/tRNA A-37 threonylcarbamoyl transferase component Bud32
MFQPNDKIGDYTLIKFLGEGTFGEVWLAEKKTRVLTSRVALKLPKSRVKFEDVEKEARVWERAKGHPNVLPIVDADIYNSQVYIASEYSPDGSLDDWLNNHGGKAPSIYATVEMIRGILAGLEHLHERQIIHRDLKPANILLQGGIPRITDFGIAKFLPSGTDSNMIKGSLAYMSPEALDGFRNEQTDVWSTAVIYYQMLCGRLPFKGATQSELIKAICMNQPHPLPVSIPEPLKDFVMIALKKNPKERYSTVSKMRKALQTAYQRVLQLGREPTIVVLKPPIVVSESTIIVDELERRRRRDGFVLIPAGEFMMGGDKYDNEKPVHKVRISRAFEMGKYQVTQAQWEGEMRSNPSKFKGANLPVEQISWSDAQEFIKKLNAKNDGYNYRLPTEAEWEYACRARRTGNYAGNLDRMGWYDKNSGNTTHPVGEKKANAWGLYDMHGNVWEWCSDWYDSGYYAYSLDVDPKGPDLGKHRVRRGGGWSSNASYCRSAFRILNTPDRRFYFYGFRLVRTYN